MSIKYIVVPSPFESGKFFVRTMINSTYTLENAIADITRETALTESEILGVATALARRRDEALLAGQKVDYGELGRYALRIRASLDRADAPLPPDYEVDVTSGLPRQTVNYLANRVTVEREQVSFYQPLVYSFHDSTTKQVDTVYTAGASAWINGIYLKFDETDAEQGVFFIAQDGAATRAAVYTNVGSTKVMLDVPAGLTGVQAVVLRLRRKEGSALLVSDAVGPLDPA